MDIILTGPAACGKTTLAQDAAAKAMKRHPVKSSWRTTELHGPYAGKEYNTPTAMARHMHDTDLVIFDEIVGLRDLALCRNAVVQLRRTNPDVIAIYCVQLESVDIFKQLFPDPF